jgi:effector-binding domain-containing protein
MTYEITSRSLEEVETAVEYATLERADVGAWLGKAYPEIAAYLERKGAGPTGPPFARYRPVGPDTFEVEAGYPASTPVGGEGEIEPSDLPAGPAATTVHIGYFDTITAAYDALAKWIRDNGGEPNGDGWDVYLSDPAAERDHSKWRTEVVMPYRTP